MFPKKQNLANSNGPTYIGNGMKIEGKVFCSGVVRVDGEIHGSVDCEGTLTIGGSARVVANIHASRVIVNGRIEGNVFAREQLEVKPEGFIVGNVSNPRGCLIIHEGAVIEGQCLTYEDQKETPLLDEVSKSAELVD